MGKGSIKLSESTNKYGFTLVELSIVLVIIGLLVSGILMGRDLIRAAQIRGIYKEIDGFRMAVNTFRLKYNCLPGDCIGGVTPVFGTDPACPSGTSATSGTCNGDGNGEIDWFLTNEPAHAWKQLALAGLIPGSFTGESGDGIPGRNIPLSQKIEAVAYSLGYFSYAGYEVGYHIPGTTMENRFVLGKVVTGEPTYGSFASPRETLGIDSKYDDGNPTIGNFTAVPFSADSPSGANLGDACAYIGPSALDVNTFYNEVNTLYCAWVFRVH